MNKRGQLLQKKILSLVPTTYYITTKEGENKRENKSKKKSHRRGKQSDWYFTNEAVSTKRNITGRKLLKCMKSQRKIKGMFEKERQKHNMNQTRQHLTTRRSRDRKGEKKKNKRLKKKRFEKARGKNYQKKKRKHDINTKVIEYNRIRRKKHFSN